MSAIRDAFLSYTNEGATEPDDRLVFFFAGHGYTITGQREVGFLIPVDGSPSDRKSLIRWDDLTREADLIRAKHILFLMDACYSGLALHRKVVGAGPNRYVKNMLARRARQVLTAGKANEVVTDGDGVRPGHSIFTAYLLQALEGEAATERGSITATGVMAYVCDRVSNDEHSRQSPHYGALDGDGDLVFDARSAATDSAPVVSAHRAEPRTPPAIWIAMAVLALLLAAVVVYVSSVGNTAATDTAATDTAATDTAATDTAATDTGKPPAPPSQRPQAVARLEKIRQHLTDFGAITRYDERNLFYGPVDLDLVNAEIAKWRPIETQLEARIGTCDAQPARCGDELLAGVPEPELAPKPGAILRYHVAPSVAGQKIDIRQQAPFIVLRGNEGHAKPLAIATMGRWTARRGPGETCDSLAGFLVFSSQYPSFRLTDNAVRNVPDARLGRVDPYRVFLFGWPQTAALQVSVVSTAHSDYNDHGTCSPTPAIVVWEPDPRVFRGDDQEMAQRATETAQALLAAHP